VLTFPKPILVVDLFPVERTALLDLLASLDADAWQNETACPGWAVRDIVAHLVADDLGRLARDRDGYRPKRRNEGEDLLAFIDRQNGELVQAMRRISPELLVTLLEVGGRETQAHFEGLHLFAIGEPVSWATGDHPAPIWLDVARELTERWHHQQQIREAVDAPLLTEPRLLRPVIETFAHALPQTFRATERPEGTVATLVVRGDSGGTWSAVRESDAWRLHAGRPPTPDAEVRLDQDDYWRLATRGLTPEAAEGRATMSGDLELARRLLTTVAIIA
jgi:uncharacterized protein (TIGR03083 family)